MVNSEPREGTSFGELGRQIYQTTYSQCHGYTNSDFRATPSVSALERVKERMSKEELRSLLETGKGQMPSFASIYELHKTAIIT